MTSSVAADKSEMASFLSGKLHHVDVDRIEKELLELWQQAGKASEDDMPSVTRACSLNFILYSTESDVELGAGMLDEITLKHPCRAILAHALPSDEEHLEAWVTARCHIMPGKKNQICCEQINVRWQGQGTRQLASVVHPLRIADLPTWLWWQKGRPTKENVGPFLGFVDRLIVDSSDMDDHLTHLFDLKEVFQRLDEDDVLYDINWMRLLPWRQTIARCFEESRGLLELEDLDLIDNVYVTVSKGEPAKTNPEPGSAGGSPASTQALLLVSWLATRLTWKLVEATHEDNTIKIAFRLGRRRIDVTISAIESKHPRGDVLVFSADFMGNMNDFLDIRHIEGIPGLQARIFDKKYKPQDIFCCVQKDPAALVIDILDDPLRGEVYEELIEVMCELAGEIAGTKHR